MNKKKQNKKLLLTEGLLQMAIDFFVGKKMKPLEQNSNSEWSRMKSLAQKIRNNQIAINKYTSANKALIIDFRDRMNNPKQLRILTNQDETGRNYKKYEYLMSLWERTSDDKFYQNAKLYNYIDSEYLDFEKSPKYSGYMDKFFQTKDLKYFNEALKYKP